VAVYSNKEEQYLLNALQQGKSLNQAASMDQGKLYEQLMNNVNQELQLEVSLNRTAKEEAEKYYTEAASKIMDIINTPGFKLKK
jgi:hypothetical protein